MTLITKQEPFRISWNTRVWLHFVVFLSVNLATCTATINAWILFSSFYKTKEDFATQNCEQVAIRMLQMGSTTWSSSPSKVSACLVFLRDFNFMWKINCVICLITSGFQAFLTGILHGVKFNEDNLAKGQFWIVFNISSTIVYILCFASSWTLPVPIALSQLDVNLIFSSIQFLPAYYVVLILNIILIPIVLCISISIMKLIENKLNKFSRQDAISFM